jgi:hypothetical protein
MQTVKKKARKKCVRSKFWCVVVGKTISWGGGTVFRLIYRHLVPLYFLPRILDCLGEMCKLEDVIVQVPCFRSSMMYAIGSGMGVGVAYTLATSRNGASV